MSYNKFLIFEGYAMREITRLKNEIRAAFAAAEYPGDDLILKNIEHFETENMREAFTGKHWKDIPVKIAEDFRISTTRFTPEGFRYFLPSFLLGALHKDPTEIDAYLIFDLIPPEESSAYARFINIMNGFTEAQRQVISKFVNRFYDANPLSNQADQNAARKFWHVDSE